MSSYGQPEDLWIDWIVGSEYEGGVLKVEPANILPVGNSLKLRTYVAWSGTNFWERTAVKTAIEGPNVKLTYLLQDLQAGGTPIRIDGGPLTVLTALDAQMTADGYGSWYWGPNDLFYRFGDSVEITTGLHGSGETLELPSAAATDGTWQVIAVLNGGVGSQVSAFSSDMFIQITK
jgi:hypothetical protein